MNCPRNLKHPEREILMVSQNSKNCQKCRGEMEIGYLLGAWSWSSQKNRWSTKQSKKISGYACKNCGYVELYVRKDQGTIEIIPKYNKNWVFKRSALVSNIQFGTGEYQEF